MSIFSEEDDLGAVIEGLKNIKGIKKGEVTLLGISQGGMVSALYAGDNPDKVEKLVLIYPALCIKDDWVAKYPKITDMPEVVNSFGMQLGRAYVEGLYDLDVYGRISRYTGPVQIIHGDSDRLVPISYSEKAHEAYKNSSFKVMPGAGHGFRGEVQQEAIGIIKEFLERSLNYYDEPGDEGGRDGQHHADEGALDMEPVVVVVLHHVLGPLDHEMRVVAEPQAVQHKGVEPVHDAPEGIGREGPAPERSTSVDILDEEAQKHTEDDESDDFLRIKAWTSGTVAVVNQAEGLAALNDGRRIVEDGLHRVPGHQEHEQREECAGEQGFE